MTGLQVSVSIRRPTDEVYVFVSDLENQPQWNTLVVASRLVAGAPASSGAVYEQRMLLRGHEMAARAVVMQAKPRRLSFTIEGLPRTINSEYSVEERNGSAQMTMTIDAGLMTRAAAPFLRPSMTESLEKLKHLLE